MRMAAKDKINTQGRSVAGSRSVRRALGILEIMLRQGESLTPSQIANALRIPKSTAYEIIQTLSQRRYIERADKAGRFFLGRRLFELGMAYEGQIDLLKDSRRIVEELRDTTGETVQLSILDDTCTLVVANAEGIQPIRVISRIGLRVPINWAAAGRLLVADLDDAALRGLLRRTVRQSPSGRGAVDIEKLARQIRRCRSQGYAIEMNEANEHTGCIAAPVIDPSERCVATLSVVAPEQRLHGANRVRVIGAVRSAADRLSRRLGRPWRVTFAQ
jgi:IclR family transcriptional regulator, KDG regulon repressor